MNQSVDSMIANILGTRTVLDARAAQGFAVVCCELEEFIVPLEARSRGWEGRLTVLHVLA